MNKQKYLIEIDVQIQTEVLSYTRLVDKESEVDENIDEMYDSIIDDGASEGCIQSISVYTVIDVCKKSLDIHKERTRKYEEDYKQRELEEQEENDKQMFKRLKKKYEG